jgi:hypothetical protein
LWLKYKQKKTKKILCWISGRNGLVVNAISQLYCNNTWKQIGQDWRYIRVGKLLVYRFCVFLYITEWSWPNFLYATPLEFRRCAKHAIKITNGEKILTLLNEILKKNHLPLCRVVHKNIHLYFSTLFNNFWILIFLKSQSW